jgi:hypothetical protein
MEMRLRISQYDSVPLVAGRTLRIGRHSESDIQITSKGIGRAHCDVGRTACAAWVRALNTPNGTFLNEERCREGPAYVLRPGDRLRMASSVFVLEADDIIPSWPGGEPGLVERLARCVRDDGDFETLPILADALEDAGCTDAAILDHLRGPGPHGQACWVLEAILGHRGEGLEGAS